MYIIYICIDVAVPRYNMKLKDENSGHTQLYKKYNNVEYSLC
jgi:hypothetical protein